MVKEALVKGKTIQVKEDRIVAEGCADFNQRVGNSDFVFRQAQSRFYQEKQLGYLS